MRFFLKKQLIKFSCTSCSLILCKINKKPESRFKVKGTPYHFCSKMTKLPIIRFLSEKPLNSMSLLAPFIVQNCKTILIADPEL